MVFKTLRFKIILFYSILFIISLSVLGISSYRIYFNYTTENMKQNIKVLTQSNANSINIYINEVMNSINIIALDKNIVELLNTYDTNSYYKNLKFLKERISNHTISNSNIENISLISEHYNFTLHSNSEKIINYNSEAMQNIIHTSNVSKYITINILPLKRSEYMYTKNDTKDLLIYFPIKDFNNNNKTEGVILIQYSFEKLVNICSKSKISNVNYVFLCDLENLPIVTINHTNTQITPSLENLSASDHYLFVEKEIESVPWKLIYVIDNNELKEKTNLMRDLVVTLIIISILASILISIYLGYNLTKALNIMRNYMIQFGSGCFDLRIHEQFNTEEMQTLSNGFNEMADRIQRLIHEAYDLEAKQKDAHIEALQARINPHFLYNSLQLISSLAILKRTDDIQIAIGSMANLYEYVLYENSQNVTVEQELTHINDYLCLQKLRLNNTLKFKFNIDSNILVFKIMKLSIQPIVENCINHAFLTSGKKTKYIYISGVKIGSKLLFEISDNGIGIDRDELNKLLNRLKTGLATENSIGLVNVQQRIQLRYGKDYGISIRTRVGHYTKVVIELPCVD
ncbi:MAG: hypothetical protein CVU98_01920 [Firmicutes bacterium HGW-Firmicutes-3]|nr:MAG: hypothetical protein CVU98_01920 [Firmicutes bacterium HGW-Firmicutes-3]